MQGEQDNTKAPTPKTGDTTTHTTPAIQHSHHTNERGTPTYRRGGQQHYRPSFTMPPHPAIPPHHPQYPHPLPLQGGSYRRIPHHTNTTDTHTAPHTPHPARHSTQHDSSTDEYHTGASETRTTRTGPGGTTAHATAIQQQHTAEDGHHPLSHCSRSHNQQTIMINVINNHRSMIDQ